MELYKQCKMVKRKGCREEVQVAFIPADKAIVGKSLRLQNWQTKEWSEGWVVESAGEGTVDRQYVVEHRPRVKFGSLQG